MSDANEVSDQNEEDEYSEADEEYNILQARWLKLARAKDHDESLAMKRSNDDRYSTYLCCQQGKRRKKGLYADSVQCDSCFGWVHRGCMSSSEWEALKDLYECPFCAIAREQRAKKQPLRNKTRISRYPGRYVIQENDGSSDEIEVEMPEQSEDCKTQVIPKIADKIGGFANFGAASQDRCQNALNETMLNSVVHRQLYDAQPLPKNSGTSSIQKPAMNSCDACKRQVFKASEAFECRCGLLCHEYCAYPDLFLIPDDMIRLCLNCQATADDSDSLSSSSGFKIRPANASTPQNSQEFQSLANKRFVSCIECSRFCDASSVQMDRFGERDFVCAECENKTSSAAQKGRDALISQRDRLLPRSQPNSGITQSGGFSLNARPPSILKAKRVEFKCDACGQAEQRKRGFTKLGRCHDCRRLLHTQCCGLPSVEYLEWRRCADCQPEEEEVDLPSAAPRGMRKMHGASAMSECGDVNKCSDGHHNTHINKSPSFTATNVQCSLRPSSFAGLTHKMPKGFASSGPPRKQPIEHREPHSVRGRSYSPLVETPGDAMFQAYGQTAQAKFPQAPDRPIHAVDTYQPAQSEETKELRNRVQQLEATLSRMPVPRSDSRDYSPMIRALPDVPSDNPANPGQQMRRSDEVPNELKLVKLLAEALGGNRIGSSLNNIKFLDGAEGPEQVRRWFHEFELITRGWSNEERREALQVRVRGRAETALQLMPRDLLDDYGKIKSELLLRLADDEPRRSANLTSLLSGCPRLPNESVEQFGARVQKLVRDAMSPLCPLSQLDELAKSYIVQWLDDEQLLPSLIDQSEHKEYRYLVDHAVNLRRNLDLHATKRNAAAQHAAPSTNRENRQQGAPSYNARWEPPAAGLGYTQNRDPVPNTFQPRNFAPSGHGPRTESNQNPAYNPGNSKNAQSSWMKPAQGQFRATPAVKPNNVAAAPHNAIAVQTAEVPTKIGILTQHPSTYDQSATVAAQTHYSISVALPVGPLTKLAAGPCAIGPVPKKDILVENMPAVSLLDSGAPVSIAEAGYLKGLLEAQGVDPSKWPIDPPSAAISVANGDPLNCVGSTILQVSVGGEAKPIRVQLTGDNLSYPVIIGTNAFADLGIQLVSVKSGASMLETEPVNLLSADFPKPPDMLGKVELCACEDSIASEKPCTEPPDPMRVTRTRSKRKKKPRLRFADPEVPLSVRAREEDASEGLNAFRVNTVLGQHWLRNVPRAHATFPPRPPDLLQIGSALNAPELQPSTSARFLDVNLHSTHGRHITRRNSSSRTGPRSSHDLDSHLLNELFSVPSRSGSRSSNDNDSHLLNKSFSVLMPSEQSSSKLNRHQKHQ